LVKAESIGTGPGYPSELRAKCGRRTALTQPDLTEREVINMAAFTINMSSPIPSSAFTMGRGGPNSGGHQAPHWYIQYGMDLGAGAGTEVHAAFDAHITRLNAHNPSHDSGKVYGAQLFLRSPNDMMGGFYTHVTDVPSGLAAGSRVSRGDLLGTVHSFGGIPPHLHLALVEIIGGAPRGRYKGVNLYSFFLTMAADKTEAVRSVTFNQNGSPPTVT
jgi:murein DD-endopeptidase MepM/ murein hydrolase activator NlpD